jgi:hypothetical protein
MNKHLIEHGDCLIKLIRFSRSLSLSKRRLLIERLLATRGNHEQQGNLGNALRVDPHQMLVSLDFLVCRSD